jgi:acyl carrier protein phosphodiesterase
MNFLAHLYLSGPQSEMMVGNFIADSIRSNMLGQFSPGVRRGIMLHQAIDTFTDKHPVVETSKERLRSRYHKYAGVITDIFYDHFLAANWKKYSEMPLPEYARNTYQFLGSHENLFPPRARMFYAYMVQRNALMLYQDLSGISMVMKGMSRRARFDSGMQTCTEELLQHYGSFQSEFEDFFPDLIRMCNDFIGKKFQ